MLCQRDTNHLKNKIMDQIVAEILENHSQGSIYKNYSGRGMYGSKTTGIVFESRSEMNEALGEIMIEGNEEEREEVGTVLGTFNSDNMGNDIIFY